MGDHRTIVLSSLLLSALALGCGDKSSDADANAAAAKAALPVVNDARKDLVLTWLGDGGPEVASSVADVPSEARREVRVQDPTIPPEAQNPDVVFLADLTRANPDGSYAVKAVPREGYEKRRSKLTPRGAIAGGPAAAQAPGDAHVVMYATKHCPVCKNARRWLLDQGIPYTEKDVEENEANAAELAAKGRAQGVPTSGVPVFEVRGRLIPGFDPDAIRAALNGALPAPAPAPQAAPQAPAPAPQMQPMQPVPSAPPAQQTI